MREDRDPAGPAPPTTSPGSAAYRRPGVEVYSESEACFRFFVRATFHHGGQHQPECRGFEPVDLTGPVPIVKRPPGERSPTSYARTTSCTRSRSFSLDSSRPTCDFTVASETNNFVATSALDSPWATATRTSLSRSVRADSSGNRSPRSCSESGTRWAYSSSNLRVTRGETMASPDATVCMASTSSLGRTSFSTKPLAPARSAPKA